MPDGLFPARLLYMNAHLDKNVQSIVDRCRALLFPDLFAEGGKQWAEDCRGLLQRELSQTVSLCFRSSGRTGDAAAVASDFVAALPALRAALDKDVRATYNGDPAAETIAEVILCYPGIRAISSYRIAHLLYEAGVPVLPRLITELAHSETGIDIHPAATIGESFAIDHGTGVVIGETAILGNNVKIYQGVTLGAKSFPLDADGNPVKGVLRHPVLEDNVIVYSNATILGRVTIGHDAIIGGNIWVTEDVPAGARVVQSPKKYF